MLNQILISKRPPAARTEADHEREHDPTPAPITNTHVL